MTRPPPAPPPPSDTRGILQPDAGLRRFSLLREAPPEDLTPFVEWIWGVRWELPPDLEHAQEVLPAPSVHLVFEKGGFFVHGPGTARFCTTLRGRGWVCGLRFRPAGFLPFSALPLPDLVDRVLPAADVLGAAPWQPANFESAKDALLAYARSRAPRPDPNVQLVNDLVLRAQQSGTLLRAEGLAALAGISQRSLHRLFARYVGVSSKWIVRRARVHDAAERVARGEAVDWAQVAQELGYSDQAHLIREFRAETGFTPAEYARRCRQRDEHAPGADASS